MQQARICFLNPISFLSLHIIYKESDFSQEITDVAPTIDRANEIKASL